MTAGVAVGEGPTVPSSPRRRWAAARGGLGIVITASLFVACSAENGHGILKGTVDMPECLFDNGVAQPYIANPNHQLDQTWNYFVGEPFDSTTIRYPENQISIRMQNQSGGWEASDAVFFWILDSYEVARCMRGRMNADGTPDWDQTACDWSEGEGRLLIGTENELVTSHMALQGSCPGSNRVGAALGKCDGGTCPDTSLCPGRGSWIVFSRFGTPPVDPSKPVGSDFKINRDDHIEASSFHVELCDQATIQAVQAGTLPIPKPGFVAALDGSFSFQLQPNFR